MAVVFLVLLVVALPSSCQAGDHYMGGSLTFHFKNTTSAGWNIRVYGVLNWQLKDAPCQRPCDDHTIGTATVPVRRSIANNTGAKDHFGSWSFETSYGGNSTTVAFENMTDFVNDRMVGHVADLNAQGDWLQEMVSFDLLIPFHVLYVDISLDGLSWRQLDYPKLQTHQHFHLQVKVKMNIRHDTGKPNASPLVLAKPLYRIPMNSTTEIKLAILDVDEDIVKCSQAMFITAGGLPHLNGVTITEDCRVKVDPHAWAALHDGGVGAVVVAVEDYPRASKNSASLSLVTAQFMLQTVADRKYPVFVAPSPETGQRFIAYVGATISIPLYARSDVSGKKNIANFTVASMPYQHWTVNMSESDNASEDGATEAVISWTPTTHDVGDYLVLVGVTDVEGNEAVPLEFKVHVPEVKFAPVQDPGTDEPYIALLPESGAIVCNINYTCIFPLFVGTPNETNIENIKFVLSEEFTGGVAELRPVNINDRKILEGKVALKSHIPGSFQACFDVIVKESGLSSVRCFNVSQDPCGSHPCGNHGHCDKNSTHFQCVCDRGWYGLLCDTDPCADRPCRNRGLCLEDGLCSCPTGFTGEFCEQAINFCVTMPNLCNGHRCQYVSPWVVPVGYHCTCNGSFTGQHCELDLRSHSSVHSSVLSAQWPHMTFSSASDVMFSPNIGATEIHLTTNYHSLPFSDAGLLASNYRVESEIPSKSQISEHFLSVLSASGTVAATTKLSSTVLLYSSAGYVGSIADNVGPTLVKDSLETAMIATVTYKYINTDYLFFGADYIGSSADGVVSTLIVGSEVISPPNTGYVYSSADYDTNLDSNAAIQLSSSAYFYSKAEYIATATKLDSTPAVILSSPSFGNRNTGFLASSFAIEYDFSSVYESKSDGYMGSSHLIQPTSSRENFQPTLTPQSPVLTISVTTQTLQTQSLVASSVIAPDYSSSAEPATTVITTILPTETTSTATTGPVTAKTTPTTTAATPRTNPSTSKTTSSTTSKATTSTTTKPTITTAKTTSPTNKPSECKDKFDCAMFDSFYQICQKSDLARDDCPVYCSLCPIGSGRT